MKFAIFALSSLALFSGAFAAEKTDNKQNQPKKSKNSQKIDDCPYASPCIKSSVRWDVFGEYLYWQVLEDQMTFASDLNGGLGPIIDIFNGPNGPGLVNEKITSKETDFKWKSGFRVGTGVTLECGTWDLLLYWTRLHSTTKTNLNDPLNGVFPSANPLASVFDFTHAIPTLASGAHNKWRFKYDVVDLDIAKEFFVNKWVSFRPLVGIKGAIINQSNNTSYDGISASNGDGTFTPVGVTSKKKNDFIGIGPKFGIDSRWKFADEWSVSSGFNFAFLYGKFKVSNDSDVAAIAANADLNFKLSQHYFRLRTTADAYLGIDWETCIGTTCMINIGAAYEVQYWWAQLQVPGSTVFSIINASPSPQGDLMMHGLTAHFGLAF